MDEKADACLLVARPRILQVGGVSRTRTKMFFDGGCRPNPGPMEAAVVLRGVTHVFDDLGFGTSSDAEWLALIRAAELARDLGFADVVLLGDARDVVRKAQAALIGQSGASGHCARFLAAAGAVAPARLTVRWIRREQNLAGIALAARHPR